MATTTPTNFPQISGVDFWKHCALQFPGEHDWLVSMVRAFRDGKADFFYIDDRRKKFQLEAPAFAESLGLLTFEEKGSDEDQYTAWEYRPTDLRKKVFLDSAAPNEYIT